MAHAGESEQGAFQPVISSVLADRVICARILWMVILWIVSWWRDRLRGNFAGDETKAFHRGPAEVAVNARAEGTRFVLQKHCRGGIAAKGEDGTGRALADPQRLRDLGDFGTGNFPPTQYERRVIETCAREGGVAEQRGVWPNNGRPRTPRRRSSCVL